MRGLRHALAFLTRLPSPALGPDPWGELAAAAAWYPAAGLVVGLFSALMMAAGAWGWTPEVGAVLGLVAAWWLTRGFHVDGLSDCFDGLLCQGDAARRLAVMKDPHAGGLGAAMVAAWIALKLALVLATLPRGDTLQALVAAAVIGRAPLAWELRGPLATPGEGLAGRIGPRVSATHAGSALLAGLVLSGGASFGALLPWVAGWIAALIVTWRWHVQWRALVGGVNGDVLGAAVELREAAVLAAFATPLLTPDPLPLMPWPN